MQDLRGIELSIGGLGQGWLSQRGNCSIFCCLIGSFATAVLLVGRVIQQYVAVKRQTFQFVGLLCGSLVKVLGLFT